MICKKQIMKKKILTSFIFAYTCISAFAQNNLYKEIYRPQFHFSPSINWCNDPNGLVYNNGIYHLFYQHNPFGNTWGHMTWAHATSKDLIHWKHLPIAIPEENGTMIFSGTCVVDKNNTSGFGKNGKIPMVAIYTGHIENVNQSQNLAYSLDDGVTWTKYANNPVLDLGKKDFRDPKVFWQENKKYWVMAVMLPVEHKVQFYSSANLKEWKYLSDFGPVGDTSGVWECPDLTQVPVDGNSTKKKWLLQMSQNASMQYFVGEFDGIKFTNENNTNEIFRPDYGPDYYAAISYNQLPTNKLPTAIGWANNWNYANDIPTTPWKSAMALPRTLSVKKIDGNWILFQKALASINILRQKLVALPNENLDNIKKLLPIINNQFELQLSITPSNKETISGVRIAVGNNTYFEIGYDNEKQSLYIDRSKSGNDSFNVNYKKMNFYEKRVNLKNNKIDLHIYFDNSIAEIFVNEGEAVFTAQLFPKKDDDKIELFSNKGKALFTNIKFWEMKSSWK
jgi:fructan beta-fructosidase